MEAALLRIMLVWTVAAVTPGPNLFLTAQISASVSRTAAAAAALGIVGGTLVWGIGGAVGIHLFFVSFPWAYSGLKIGGGLYLVYLGGRLLLSARRLRHADGMGSPIDPWRAWRVGLATNLSNPKTALFTASLFAANMPADPPVWLSVAAVMIMGVVSAVWYGMVAFAFGAARVNKAYRDNGPAIDMAAGGILVGFGTLFLLESVP